MYIVYTFILRGTFDHAYNSCRVVRGPDLHDMLSVEVRCYISCVNTVVAVIYDKHGR